MIDEAGGLFAAVHLCERPTHWLVGVDGKTGLPVPSFDAALQLADTWLKLAGADAAFVQRLDGTESRHVDKPILSESDDFSTSPIVSGSGSGS